MADGNAGIPLTTWDCPYCGESYRLKGRPPTDCIKCDEPLVPRLGAEAAKCALVWVTEWAEGVVDDVPPDMRAMFWRHGAKMGQ